MALASMSLVVSFLLILNAVEYISCQASDEAKAPRGLSVLSTQSTSVVLHWQLPQEQSGLSSFSVEYSQYGAAAASGAVHHIPVGVLLYSLVNLEPFTFYSIRVSSVFGTARYFSQPVNVTTQQDVPEEPTSLSADTGPLWAKISWQPPDKPNGVILYYLLVVEEATFGASDKAFNTTDHRLSFTVTSLNPYTCYGYTVTAATAAGTGAQTSKHFFCTEQYASSAPMSLQVKDVGPHAVLLRWESPSQPNGIITSYLIRYQHDLPDVLTTYEASTNSSDTSFLLSGLVPITPYTVSVAAINGAGVGVFSAEKGFTTAEPILGAPTQFVAVAVSASVISLMWGPPLTYSSFVHLYIIEYHKHGEIPQQISISAREMNYTAVGLAPYTDYKFRLQAMSESGNGSWTSEVTVRTQEGESSPPTILNATLLSPTSASLSWASPVAPHGVVVSYSVHIVEGNSSHRTLSTGHNQTKLVITDLYPGKDYRVTVAAVNGIGEGLQSIAVNISTPLPVLDPSGAPTVLHVNSTSISLEWGPPREFPQFVQFYVLQCIPQSLLLPAHVITYNTTLTRVTADNLLPYTEYAFKVAVVSEAGQGAWSSSTLQRTEAFIPMPVERLQVSNVSANVIELTWHPPTHSNGPITSYFLYWSSGGVSHDGHVTIPPDIHHFVLPSVIPYTAYTITVSVANTVGRSENRSISVRTPEAVSGPPEHFQVTNATSTSLSFSWAPPLNPGGPISHYVLRTSSQEPVLLVTGLNTTVSDLQPFTVYNTTVQAVNGLGPGTAAAITTRTGEGRSSSPGRLQVVGVSSSSVSLLWEEPQDVRGVLDYYLVSCMTGPTYQLVEVVVTGAGVMLTNLTHTTTYNISVAAVNGWGIGEWTHPLLVNTSEEVLGPPTNIKTVNITMTTITLSWQPPERPSGVVHGYQVTVSGTILNTLPWQHTLRIINLTPGSKYNVVIQALNDLGRGGEPSTFFTQTLDPVLSAPVNLKVMDVGPRHLTLEWTHPHNFTHTITHYSIHYSSETWGEVGVVHTNSTITTVSLNEMEEATLYVIQVSAENRAGPGQPAAVQGRTYSDAPSGTPKNFTVLEVSAGSVTLSWEAPPLVEQNGDLTGYAVNYSTTAFPSHTVRSVSESFLTLSSLRPLEEVVVSVAAVNSNGTGPYTIPLSLRLPANISGAVRGVHSELLVNGSTEVSVEVDPLVWQYVQWTQLTISPTRGGGSVFASDRTVSAVEYGGPQVYIVDELEPFVPYWFVLRAQSRGSSSTEVVKEGVTFTKEGAPLSAVANVRGDRINGTSAILTWTALSFEVARGFPLYIVHCVMTGSGHLATAGREQQEGEGQVGEEGEEVTSATSAVIRGLLLTARYTVTVTAATRNGDLRGPPSEALIIEATETEPGGASSGRSARTSWLLVALIATGSVMSVTVVLGLVLGCCCSRNTSHRRRLQVSKLYKIGRSSQSNCETQEEASRPVTPAPVISPLPPPPLPSSFSTPAGIALCPSLSTGLPPRRTVSSVITLGRDDSGYIDAGLEQPVSMGAGFVSTSF